MKIVTLIGDSIRMGYQDIVRNELDGIAEVWAPAENGGNSTNVLAHIDDWVIHPVPDVIHLNCGLADLAKEFRCDTADVPLGEYSANVRTILRRLESVTKAQIVWASTTPVNEKRHHANVSFDRFESDVVQYNESANSVAKELGIAIDDLFGFVNQCGRDTILLEDGAHFRAEGYKLIGKRVAEFVRPFVLDGG